MKTAVIGPGAMGCLFAGLLAEAGNEVWLLDKSSARANLIGREGIRLEGIGGSRRVPVRVSTDAAEVGPAALVLVWVKAYDTSAAVQVLPSLLGADTWVLSLQNGLGNLDLIAGAIGPGRVLGGVTSHGATLIEDGCSRHTGVGDTVVGALNGPPPEPVGGVIGLLREAGIQTRTTQDLRRTLWSKLLVNATVNPLTALTGLRNGDLPRQAASGRLLETVSAECERVAAESGIALDYDSLEQRVRAVCEATAPNRSSMLQDVLRGRRTEIDAINGSVVSQARAVGQPAPVNELLVGLVKCIERRAPEGPGGRT